MGDFEKSVAGWKQAVAILEANQRALDWAMDTIDLMAAGETPRDQAERYHEARQARNTANAYLKSMRAAGAL